MLITAMRYFAIYIRGVLMGVADVVPGVSGGTVAMITRIYERLITIKDNYGKSKRIPQLSP